MPELLQTRYGLLFQMSCLSIIAKRIQRGAFNDFLLPIVSKKLDK